MKKEQIKLEVHLEGKSSNSNLISLDDLQNLVIGINGISKFLIKEKLGKGSRGRMDKEAQEICSLGVKDLKKGSAILEVEDYPDGQQKLDDKINIRSIMEDVTKYIDSLDERQDSIPLNLVPYLDHLTKPLNQEKAFLEVSVFSNDKLIIKTKKLSVSTRKVIQTILDKKKIKSDTMYGVVKEINLKDYSAKIQLFNKKLEKFYFDSDVWEKIRDYLESKVEINFEGNKSDRKMIAIKKISNFQEKKEMTTKDLLNMGIIGSLSGRTDIKNAKEYAKKLSEDLFK